MRLTETEFKSLEPYQEHFKTAIKAQWARHPGTSALDLMQTILSRVTGVKQNINMGCSHCVMRLLKELGTIYFADQQERSTQNVEISTQDVEPVKVKVKVKRGRKPKTQE